MSAFRLHTLKQKLWAIVLASFVARVIIFFSLPNTPSSLAPDEGTYASLTKWISESRPASEFESIGEGLYLSGRSFFIPAAILTKTGLDELTAVRLTSLVYGCLISIILLFVAIRLLNLSNQTTIIHKKNQTRIISAFTIFSFMPSHLLWSVLGLRESTNEFWVVITLVATHLLFCTSGNRRVIWAFGVIIGVYGTFSARPQVGWVLVASLFAYSCFRLKEKISYILILVVVVGLLGGIQSTTALNTATEEVFEVSSPSGASNENLKRVAVPKCEKDLQVVVTGGVELICKKVGEKDVAEGLINPIAQANERLGSLTESQNSNTSTAESKIQEISCPFERSSRTTDLACLLYRTPYSTFTFLFRPLMILDTTSEASIYAALENLLWVIIFLFILWQMILPLKIRYHKSLVPSVILLILYSVAAGAYEDNLGTAFRHKSMVLAMVLLIALAVSWHEDQELVNSQENAV